MRSLDITTRDDGAIRIVAVAGELDAAGCDEFLLRASAPDARPELVVVDLRAATFLDSHALSTLIELRETTAGDAIRLAIIRPTGRADRIFTLTGMDAHLPLYDGGARSAPSSTTASTPALHDTAPDRVG